MRHHAMQAHFSVSEKTIVEIIKTFILVSTHQMYPAGIQICFEREIDSKNT